MIAHLVKFLGHIFHLDKLDYCISGLHFCGSLQNAYLGEELKGFCIIKIRFLFSFRGAMPL